MRNMSFMLTTQQVRDGTKTVTRRIGWWFLKPGDRLMACVKCQGLGKGGKIEKIREIEVVRTEREKLKMAALSPRRPKPGVHVSLCPFESELEGFPTKTGEEFVAMFCEHMRCTPETIVNRIEFKYVEGKR